MTPVLGLIKTFFTKTQVLICSITSCNKLLWKHSKKRLGTRGQIIKGAVSLYKRIDQGRYLVAGTAGDQVEEEGNYQEFLSQEIKLRGRFRGELRNPQA